MAEYQNPQFQNPSQGPGQEKNTLTAFVLMFVVVLAMQYFLPKPQPQPQTPAQTSATPAQPGSSTATTPVMPAATNKKATPTVAAAKTSIKKSNKEAKQATEEKTTVIETAVYKITLTNKGAQVKSWILKQHRDNDGSPLDLVHKQAAEQYGYPLSLYTYDEALRTKLNSVLYVVDRKEPAQLMTSTVKDKQSSQDASDSHYTKLTFEYADADTTVRKVFRFDQSYVMRVETHVEQNGATITALPAWPAGLGDQKFAYSYGTSRIDYMHDATVERKAPVSGFFLTGRTYISNGNTVNGPFFWAGTVDQYFGAIFLPDDPNSAALVEFNNAIPQNPAEPDAEKKKKEVFNVLGTAVGSTKGDTSLRLFVGPKNLESLNAVRGYVPGEPVTNAPSGPDLEGTVEFGMFGIIAKPLFLLLRYIQEHAISNWGWAIVMMTVLINLSLFPLRWSGMKSGLMMQKIQPEINAINRKYQGLKLTDPRQQEKQKEVQELYAREKINPMASCLPMLIQMPFLYAFYAMLSTTTELRNANWLWVHDLSSPDSLHLLPILLVVSMFVMQKITPTPGMDQVQARMMQTMMPLMLGGISWALPAGLGVYWVASNMVGFLMQFYVNNTKFAKEVRAHINKRQLKQKK